MSFDLARKDLIRLDPRNLDLNSAFNYDNPIEDLTVKRISNRAYIKLERNLSRANILISTLGDLCKFSYLEILKWLNDAEISANSIQVLVNSFGLTLKDQEPLEIIQKNELREEDTQDLHFIKDLVGLDWRMQETLDHLMNTIGMTSLEFFTNYTAEESLLRFKGFGHYVVNELRIIMSELGLYYKGETKESVEIYTQDLQEA